MVTDADHELAERVRVFVARETGITLAAVMPETTLAAEVGLGGDDAGEFFEAFAREFGVDRESLGRLNLAYHFGTEAECTFFPSPACLVLIVAVGFVATAAVDAGSPWWAVALGAFVVLWLVGWVQSRLQVSRHRDDPDTIRVQDLVNAAAAKRWGR